MPGLVVLSITIAATAWASTARAQHSAPSLGVPDRSGATSAVVVTRSFIDASFDLYSRHPGVQACRASSKREAFDDSRLAVAGPSTFGRDVAGKLMQRMWC